MPFDGQPDVDDTYKEHRADSRVPRPLEDDPPETTKQGEDAGRGGTQHQGPRPPHRHLLTHL